MLPNGLNLDQEMDPFGFIIFTAKGQSQLDNMFERHVVLTFCRFIVGIPLDISVFKSYSDIKLNKAELTFEYDEDWLPEGMEDNLAICRFTDENGFEIVDGYKLDKKNNTITCNTEIPGYYFMVNRKLME